jgi:hypothetical protein
MFTLLNLNMRSRDRKSQKIKLRSQSQYPKIEIANPKKLNCDRNFKILKFSMISLHLLQTQILTIRAIHLLNLPFALMSDLLVYVKVWHEGL